MPFRAVDLSQLPGTPCSERRSLLRAADLVAPGAGVEPAAVAGLHPAAGRIAKARLAGRPVICMLGPWVITQGLGLLVVDLLRRGIVTHLATSGIGSGHDFELGALGATAAADAASGLSEEGGTLLHQAIRRGARDGLGLGEALGRFLAEDPRCQRPESSVAFHAHALGVPYTVHVAIGADAVCQHSACDFAALGWASGQDFGVLCASVAELQGGVLLNAACGPSGEEAFLTALAAARCLGHEVATFAAVDLVDPGNDRAGPAAPADQQTCRLTGDPVAALAGLCALLRAAPPVERAAGQAPGADSAPEAVTRHSTAAAEVLHDMLGRHPELRSAAPDLARAYLAIVHSLAHGGTLFLCGNGGSLADALHISAEMLKSYVRPRPLPAGHCDRLSRERNGEALAANLQRGLRAIVLGANSALTSAVNNDFAARDLNYAQELYALARPGDGFLGISTSGQAANVGSAASVARALGLATIALTGSSGGPLAGQVDVAIRAPATRTDRIQEQHIVLYHTLCEMLEVDLLH